jgi:protein-disulfide isomerase
VSRGRLTLPPDERDHALGPADAPVTLVEYGDFECPNCLMAHPIVKAARRRLGDRLRVIWRHFPLSEIHPHARHAAEAAEAAAEQGKFWAMHDAILDHQHALEDEDLARYADGVGADGARVLEALREGTYAARVRADFRGGVRSGVNGTPTFFVNGARYDGAWADEGAFIRALRRAADAVRAGTP